MSAHVYGVGTSNFGRQPDVPLRELAWDAVREAFADAQHDRPEAVYVGTVFGESGIAQRTLSDLGIVGVPVLTIENACASGTTALHEAADAVERGRYRVVLALGLEQLSTRGPLHPEPRDPEGGRGLSLPGTYAMNANRYMHVYGLTREQLALVSIKNHRNAIENSRAQFAGEYSIAEVLESPMIADPITRLQCCPLSDGAAAAVVGTDRGRARDVPVLAHELRSGWYWDHRSTSACGFKLVEQVAVAALGRAQVRPADLGVLEVHDAFTIGELVATEAIGLAPEGHGADLLERGHTWRDGAQPVNPSGGLLSRGHPLGATGLAQVAEICWQLRGEAGRRQVKETSLGLVETMGGGVAGIEGNACVVFVLGRRPRHVFAGTAKPVSASGNANG
ncbi:MAG: thiolase family protein [Lautropia sp.]